MERKLCLGREGKSIVDRQVNVVEDVECSVPVAFGWFVIVGRQEGVGQGEVGPCALSQPTDRTDHTLVSLLAFEEAGQSSASSDSGHASMGSPER